MTHIYTHVDSSLSIPKMNSRKKKSQNIYFIDENKTNKAFQSIILFLLRRLHFLIQKAYKEKLRQRIALRSLTHPNA